MSRKAAHARTKFYLAVFAVGLIASGIVIGTQFSRQLSASANPTQSTGTVTKVSDNEYVYTNGKTVYHYNRFWSNTSSGSSTQWQWRDETNGVGPWYDMQSLPASLDTATRDAVQAGWRLAVQASNGGSTTAGSGTPTSPTQASVTYTISPNEAGKTSYKCVPSSHPTESATFKIVNGAVFWAGPSKDYEISQLPAIPYKDALSAEKKAWIQACASKVKAVAAGSAPAAGDPGSGDAGGETGTNGDTGESPKVPVLEPQELGDVQPLPAIQLENFFKAASLQEIILKTIPNFLLALVGLLAMAFFFLNAIRYIFSAGNAEVTGEAKTGMLYAAVGVVLVVLSYGIIDTVRQLLGS